MTFRFDHFSHLAPFYDRAIPFKASMDLIKYGELTTDDLVLDAGGGTGRVAEAISPHVRKVVIADLSRGMLLEADGKGIEAVLSPVESLPFSEGVFSRAIMIDALHHVLDHQKAADEMWRILAPGGVIIIQEPNIKKFGVKLIALVEKVTLMRSHFLDSMKITGLFENKECELAQVDDGYSTWVIIKKPI